MNKNVLITVVALVVLVGGYFLLRGGKAPEVSAPSPQQGLNETSAPQAAIPSGIVISIRNHKITQPIITVPVGATVTWNNEDDLTGFPYSNHSPTSGRIDPTGQQGKKGVVPNSGSGVADGTFTLALASGESHSFTFTEAGTYTYYIAEHPLVSGEGKIIVEENESPISMSAGTFFFNPKTLNAKIGKKVTLDVMATGQHTFTVDELGVNVPLPHGKTTRVEFTPTKSGVFTYYCAIPGHREAGQIGSLTVE